MSTVTGNKTEAHYTEELTIKLVSTSFILSCFPSTLVSWQNSFRIQGSSLQSVNEATAALILGNVPHASFTQTWKIPTSHCDFNYE